MSIPIIQEAEVHEERHTELIFRWRDDPGAGFGFPCDEHGNVDESKLPPEAIENWHKCRDGVYDVVNKGVETYVHHWKTSKVGRCPCGEEVCLDGFTNTCDKCGADYNWNGDRLAPRDQWGEETGEHLSDILRIR